MQFHRFILALLIVCSMAPAAHARSPLASLSANLNLECNPSDPVDWLRSKITPLKFWREQQYDFESFSKSSTANLLRSRSLLAENRDGINDFRAMVAKRARELNLNRAKTKEMMDDNIKDWDNLAKKIGENIKDQQKELAWANKCLVIINKNLRDLGYLDSGQRGYNVPR
ncbi:MAG: hypothetical protein OQK35_04050 [Alphaproteobacteria bacterium]|nr:hypothetical protein [Rhodospirillales bacterium]MCW9045486.1 hypothetical protein [Alphaproteobacteria bacterium]